MSRMLGKPVFAVREDEEPGLGAQQPQRDGREGGWGHCLFVPALHTGDGGRKGFRLEIQAISTFGAIRQGVCLIQHTKAGGESVE